MTEEKKEQPAPAEKKPEAKQEQPAPAEKKPEEKKKKKINRLSIKELEEKLKQTQEKMGNLDSSFAQQLLKRKQQLLPEAGGEDATAS